VKLYVGYLRRKLGGRVEIETVRGFGYRFRPAS
jgi:DNA-binding response OmpR family regulator